MDKQTETEIGKILNFSCEEVGTLQRFGKVVVQARFRREWEEKACQHSESCIHSDAYF